MKRAEREALLRQGVAAAETPRDRRNLAGLVEDLRDNPAAGQELPLRLRNFRPSTDAYLAALGGPRAYMVRLRQIDELVDQHREALGAAWLELADVCHDAAAFAAQWNDLAGAWSFDEVVPLRRERGGVMADVRELQPRRAERLTIDRKSVV